MNTLTDFFFFKWHENGKGKQTVLSQSWYGDKLGESSRHALQFKEPETVLNAALTQPSLMNSARLHKLL